MGLRFKLAAVKSTGLGYRIVKDHVLVIGDVICPDVDKIAPLMAAAPGMLQALEDIHAIVTRDALKDQVYFDRGTIQAISGIWVDKFRDKKHN